jgi:hypothetical protein
MQEEAIVPGRTKRKKQNLKIRLQEMSYLVN